MHAAHGPSHCRDARRLFTPRPLAWAVAAACAWPVWTAQAGTIIIGQVSPNPVVSPVSGAVSIGNSAFGELTVNGGTQLTVDQVSIAQGPTGVGDLIVQGTGSRVVITRANGTSLDIGGAGDGGLLMLGGGTVRYGGTGSTCASNCRTFIGNAAGSQGHLWVEGAGSAFETAGTVTLGNASVFSLAVGDAFNYGTPGATTRAEARVLDGGQVRSSGLFMASPGGGTLARTGAEGANSSLLIEGANSAWTLVRESVNTGARALLAMATGSNTSAEATVRNGGKLVVDGSVAAGEFSGINLAANSATSSFSNVSGQMAVRGADARVEFTGGRGFFNVGRGANAVAELTVASGGVVTGIGNGETGLTYVGVGRGGGTGTARVVGDGSLLRLNGANSGTNSDTASIPGGGAFLSVGRSDAGVAGTGTLSVLSGGRVQVDTQALALTNANGQTGFGVGWDAGSVGQLRVSGRDSVTGTASRLEVLAGSGMAPYAAVGRNGGNGTLMIDSGGVVSFTSSHVSQPNANVYLPGDVQLFEIGRRSTSGTEATSGAVTVTGPGSRLSLGGAVDSLVYVGRGNAATGTLAIADGGLVQANLLIVGQDAGGIGSVNLNGGRLELGGVLNGGPGAGLGGSLAIGRNGGSGMVSLSNGAVVQVDSTAPSAGVRLGGTGSSVGGTGVLNVSGGSRVTVDSPNAVLAVGSLGAAGNTGTGSLLLSGVGSVVEALGTGAQVLIGAAANTVGQAIVGAGAVLRSAGILGVAHNGTDSSAGQGSLIVNGTVNATTVYNGVNGYIGGTGTINGNVVNLGTINPGNSPGRLVINGNFDNSGGTLVLEVKDLGGGNYAYDELVFGPGANYTLGNGGIRFDFIDGTDPLAFLASSLFDLDSFFKLDDGNGNTSGISSLGDAAVQALFGQSQFGADATGYSFNSFSYDPGTGGLSTQAVPSNPVPLPGTAWLALLGLGAAWRVRRPRA